MIEASTYLHQGHKSTIKSFKNCFERKFKQKVKSEVKLLFFIFSFSEWRFIILLKAQLFVNFVKRKAWISDDLKVQEGTYSETSVKLFMTHYQLLTRSQQEASQSQSVQILLNLSNIINCTHKHRHKQEKIEKRLKLWITRGRWMLHNVQSTLKHWGKTKWEIFRKVTTITRWFSLRIFIHRLSLERFSRHFEELVF